jgi:hypothetical protein
MAWLLETKIENEETKYRIWSTVVDEWIVEWSSREEMIKFLFWEKFQEFMYSFSEEALKFPHMWFDKTASRKIFMSDEEEMEVKKFKRGKKDADIFKEIIAGMKIELTVKDSDGHYL